MLATRAFWSGLSAANGASTPIRRPPKISCNIGDAMPMMPMPALTFRSQLPLPKKKSPRSAA